MRRSWTRVCIDLDDALNPIATSWERHVERSVVAYGQGPDVSPFDSSVSALEVLLVYLRARQGEQHTLW